MGEGEPYPAESPEESHQELPVKQLSLNMPSALSPPPTQKQSHKISNSRVYLKMTANLLMILMRRERIKQWQQNPRLDK